MAVTLSSIITGSTVQGLQGILGPQGIQGITGTGTNLGITNGTTSAPVITSSSGTDATIPAANTTVSGAVTTVAQTFSGVKTLSGPVFNDGYTEEVFVVTGTTPALSPTNGSIQTWDLTGDSTPTIGTWDSGQSIILMVDDGTSRTISWPVITWVNNAGIAPTLATTGYTVISLWKVSTIVYGALVGDGS